ncbi:MAG: murein L,D-transpeptidase catalytic domain family protein [Chryseobacterium sp.]|uniref:murein L,D-transpeptidase catalytic domain family protein n=1 Tax=Chryseobacterium carnipullorum TaxID=1124835 RepID=UPI00091B1934|nr:murein L,D-transpeptidase catalytic domain family protein [Chryseobacterium carnipullorum]MDN5395311.1 murein L,D-transpeptidase catalytic domain family protein [Chryseobacterium sp.]MDN5422023.1 murein L,D-transpeptidase catalytic domain family protein [Chryseobacterium sp.]MDN5477714.1 murein L,D-transpeptidase catalytic domain family protein [Chryseobacterium sp.]SHL68379.1 L,D-transpeptidase catalytic domain [Chryseobacterium carnipullorum]
MRGIYSVLGLVYMVTTSFYLSPGKAVKTGNVNTAKIEKVADTKSEKTAAKASSSEELYKSIPFDPEHELNYEVFSKALTGFENLKKAGLLNQDSHLLTICDFSMSSNTKRLWVIDTNEKKVLFNSLVAHGKNTGEEFAANFSNTESSLQSSLGFYITDATYQGDNGYSLKLLGMDKGFNDAAYRRAIVMHGADYVSDEFASVHKRIGRSWGCPAVPRALTQPIINTIKGRNCLFIYYPDQKYLSSSEWLRS